MMARAANREIHVAKCGSPMASRLLLQVLSDQESLVRLSSSLFCQIVSASLHPAGGCAA